MPSTGGHDRRAAASGLPIVAVLDDLLAALADNGSAVLVAPPGAGKTTLVPLAILDAPWLAGAKILLVEPRRLAARAAAERMSSTLGERVGEVIGIRARLDTMVGPRTRIEVLTEGVFTRMILDDPELSGVGAVIFDEFHERSLDGDLGLALALDARAGFRPDLRLLVMSATLDATGAAALLGHAPVITSEGRTHPVVTRYLGRQNQRSIEDQVAEATRQALATETGSILVFLPGQGEIARVATRLAEGAMPADVDVVVLHGGIDRRAQGEAIAPAATGRRKVVLATAIAETSITIEGVRVVIDCGLERVPRYEPDVGVTRLVTERVSRASADQRRGRAGRTAPGVCLRLWDAQETMGLKAFRDPEIRSADLSPLLLDCAAWGVSDPGKLAWLDAPPGGAMEVARGALQALGAIDADGRLTAIGQALRSLPLPPRLAHMVIAAAGRGAEAEAAEIAAILVERGLGGNDTDVVLRLAAFRRDRSRRASAMRALAANWARAARRLRGAAGSAKPDPSGTSPAALLGLAYPERIAKARGAAGQFLLANGRAAALDPHDPLARAPLLVVAEMAGAAERARILLAASASEAEIMAIAGDRLTTRDETTFDVGARALRSRRTERLGAIVLKSEPRPVVPGPETAAKLAEAIAAGGVQRLAWSSLQRQLLARAEFVRLAGGGLRDGWPDLSEGALSATVQIWLAPFLGAITSLAGVTPDLLGAALDALLPWSLRQHLDDAAPTHYTAPTGHRHPIDYESEGAPILAIRVQELFGLTTHPALADGRLPVTLHLLSPAGRPMQITRDLPGFWTGSWRAVRSEMRGRYPKHPWPEDPRSAAPTARAKPRPT